MVNLTWYGAVFSRYGYGTATRNYVIELDRLGVNIYLKSAYAYPFRISPYINPSMLIRLKELMRNRINESEAVHITHLIAPNFTSSGKYNIGYTVWETDHLNPKWVNVMNENVDEVWTASHFCKTVFERSGVRKPIYVMPHGVNPERFNVRVKPARIVNRKRFIFLSILDWTPRKNPQGLIEAYYKAFNRNDDVCLLLKVWGISSLSDKLSEIRRIQEQLGVKGNAPKLLWYSRYIHEDDLPRLYRACDAFVLPTRGEGWGLPCSEAMGCGLPTIATDCSGLREFMDHSNSYLIRVKGYTPVRDMIWIPHYIGFSHRWAEPDIDHLAQLMRYVYENPEEARERGIKGMEYLHRNFTWRQSAEKMLKRLEVVS